MKKYLFLLLLLAFTSVTRAQQLKALFDYTKNETAGNADWVIDSHQPIPSPDQSGITATTPESYWLGAISAWGVNMVQHGFYVASLTKSYGITYGDTTNPYDLSKYNVYIVCEPQNPFTTAEKQAIASFVLNGGGLMMVSDHNGSDRDNDGWDSPMVWDDLRSDSLFGIHFQSTGESNNNISEIATNLAPGNDPLINGQAGTVTGISYHNGTTLNILPNVNPYATGHIWMNGAPQGNSQIMFATSRYGRGKVAAVGDSSPADDGSAEPGNSSIYNGWTEAGSTDYLVFLNSCLWFVTQDTVAQVTLVSPANLASGVPQPVAFKWNLQKTAIAYQLVVSLSDAFTVTAVNDSVLTDTSFSGASLLGDTTYYWKVRAKGSAGWGAYSNAQSFVSGPPVYTIVASAGGNGDISPSGNITVTNGASQSFTMQPDTGYHVDSLLIDGVNAGSDTAYTFSNVSTNHTIRAVFAINVYQITVTQGANGSIAPSGVVNVSYGASRQFAITPSAGYRISGVYIDSVFAGAHPTFDFQNVTANHTFTALFTDTCVITAAADSNGEVNPSGQIYMLIGARQRFSFVPAHGYVVDTLLVDGNIVADSTSGFTFDSVTANHTLRVSFKIPSISWNIVENRGWNLVSLPVTFPIARLELVFPGASAGLFEYDGQYIQKDTLIAGYGYWAKFPAAVDTVVFGVPVAVESLSVQAGWNLIGSISYPLLRDSVVAVPPELIFSGLFGYNNGYIASDTLKPGEGYWIKASEAGMLIMNAGVNAQKPKLRKRIATTHAREAAATKH